MKNNRGKILANIIIIFFIGTFLSLSAYADHRPILIVGDDEYYPPYSFIDEKGEPTGFNIELIKALGEAIGYEVEVRLAEWSKTREALENGELDIISGMVYSPEREKIYSFSLKHSVNTGDIFTRKGTKIHKLEELRGQTIVVQRADVVAEHMASLREEFDLRFIEVRSAKEAIQAVSDGSYDYAALMSLPALYTIKEDSIKNIEKNNMSLLTNDYGMAVLKGNEELLMELNNGLQIIKESGEYQEIYDRWISLYQEVSVLNVINKFWWIPFLMASLFIGLLLMTMTLRYLVAKKTKELKEANELLIINSEEIEANIEELTAIEEELRAQNELLRESEENLRGSEAKSQSIIKALPDLVFTFSKDGRIINAHVGDEKQLYIPKEKFIGKKITNIMPPYIAEKGIEAIEKAFSEDEVQTFQYELEMNKERGIYEIRIIKSMEDEAIGIVRDITSVKLYQENMEYLSYHDFLTGLYNRHYFEEKLIELEKEENLPLCLIMADVNGLKLINDSFGHKTGDELLIKVGEVLKKACVSGEFLFRIGGDEFVILFPHMKNGQAEELINNIKDLASKERINSIELSISFGWAAKYNLEEDIHDIFNKAENLMYKRKLFEAPSLRGKTINAIINTLYEKNRREEEHSRRVSELASELAQALEMTQQEIDEIRTMGLLHDIGKIAINEGLLNKEGGLTPEEYEEIKLHPEIGYRILSSVNDMADMAEYVLYHHEKWDGTGYPKGIKGTEIPLQSRLIAIVDAFDAMVSYRTYKQARSTEEAVSELRKYSGTQFDADLVEVFINKVLK